MTKHRCPGLEVHEVFAVVGVETLFSVAATMDSRLPDFQELDLWPRRACQDMTGGGRLVFSFGIVDLAMSKERQRLTKHCHQHCYRELEDQVSVQTLSADWQHSIQSELRPVPPDCWMFTWTLQWPSFCYSISLQTWYLDFVHGDSYHLTTEEDTIPVDHCDPRSIQPSWCGLYLHSCPTLPRFSTALYMAVKKSLQAK